MNQKEQKIMARCPLVSVIIIFYNAEKFILEAIESVYNQTYHNWELFLIDDGSTDGSTQIARRSAEQNPCRVYYLDHKLHQNCGKVASRNLGIVSCKGLYVGFLDSDDVWLPNKLEQQVAILNSYNNAGMVYGLDQYWYSWAEMVENRRQDYIPKLGVEPNKLFKPPSLLPLFLRGKAAIPCPTSILVKRDIFNKVGGFELAFNGIYNIYEDQAFYAKLCLTTTIFASDKCWSRYRQHPDQSCAVAHNTGQEYVARLYFLNWLTEYLKKEGVTENEIWQALRKELWRCRPSWPHLPTCGYNFTRLVKKWILRLEEKILPGQISRRFWTRK
jgi:glycosyltransferase involved in cell wall biosynthesis